MNLGLAKQQLINSLQKIDTHHDLEADLILAHVLKTSREYIIAHPEIVLTKKQLGEINSIVSTRKKHYPLSYILKSKEFYGLNFYVDDNVLIPRPESEFLVEKAVKFLNNTKGTRVLELGGGSGCISISILHYSKFKINLECFEVSKGAADIIRLNSKMLKNSKKPQLHIIQKDFTKHKFNNKYQVIVSNPPYLTSSEIQKLDPGVKNFEPKLALLAKNNGQEFYRAIYKIINNSLDKNNGLAILELNARLAKTTFTEAKKMLDKNWTINLENDLSNKPRYLLIFPNKSLKRSF